MGKRLGIAGYQNTGKSYTRRWIPDGDNVVVVQPSVKASYLYKGPKDAHKLSTDELDKAIKEGKRKMIGDFDLVHPEGQFKSLEESVTKIPNSGPHTNEFDSLDLLNKKKPAGFFKKEHVKGNVILAPKFEQVVIATEFVNKHMPWVHTLILPDFTHFITETLTSEEFLNRKYGNEAFARYIDLAANAFKSFIKASDALRKDLVVVTEYHIEENKELGQFELFVPGGKMVKEKFLPSSYYDFFLFTHVKYETEDDEAEAEYQYVTRKTKRYPEARSSGLYEEMFAPNNLQEALTRLRNQFNIPVNYE